MTLSKTEPYIPIVVAYGGGTNSTSLLTGWVEKGLKPVDLILFADTGGEKPHTYEYIDYFSDWLEKEGYPRITVVRKTLRNGNWEPLLDSCVRLGVLPSIAYGFKTCSQKYKIAPQDKFLNHWKPAKKSWKEGNKVIKLLGYDYGEKRRYSKAITETDKYLLQFPLVEWQWDRSACIDSIKRFGLKLPGKSACFFCPSSRKEEIIELKRQYPELLEQALKMEDIAKPRLKSVKGLGRNYSWRDYIEGEATEEECPPTPCVSCYDGD